jgi:hypothetical protein
MNNNGSEDTVVKLPSGVAFHWVRRDGETRTFGSDLSGRGAALSSWGIYVGLAAALEICPEYRDLDKKMA